MTLLDRARSFGIHDRFGRLQGDMSKVLASLLVEVRKVDAQHAYYKLTKEAKEGMSGSGSRLKALIGSAVPAHPHVWYEWNDSKGLWGVLAATEHPAGGSGICQVTMLLIGGSLQDETVAPDIWGLAHLDRETPESLVEFKCTASPSDDPRFLMHLIHCFTVARLAMSY